MGEFEENLLEEISPASASDSTPDEEETVGDSTTTSMRETPIPIGEDSVGVDKPEEEEEVLDFEDVDDSREPTPTMDELEDEEERKGKDVEMEDEEELIVQEGEILVVGEEKSPVMERQQIEEDTMKEEGDFLWFRRGKVCQGLC